jgi:hypothetical protein
MKIKISVFVFFFSICGYAQYTWSPATVYLKDTIALKGEAIIKQGGGFRMLPKETLKFRKNKEDKAVKIESEAVDSIIFTLKYIEKVKKKKVKKERTAIFVTKYVEEKKKRLHFLEVLIDGDLQLLGRTYGGGGMSFGPGMSTPTSVGNIPNAPMVRFYGGHNLQYLSKNNIMAQHLYSTKSIANYFKDCPVLEKKVKEEKLKSDDLETIIGYYLSDCN